MGDRWEEGEEKNGRGRKKKRGREQKIYQKGKEEESIVYNIIYNI